VFYTQGEEFRMTSQASLFEPQASATDELTSIGPLPHGLIYVPDFIAISEERNIIAVLDDPAASWLTDLSRRVQHYGFRYNYKARALSLEDKIGDLPAWAQSLGERLVQGGYFSSAPDQVIVNEYEPGQGISPHVDRETCFGASVASLSIGSDVVMDFQSTTGAFGSVLLPARSMIVLTDEARYDWKHSIASRRRDRIGTRDVTRERRLSLTFRSVLLESC
jgi:alkylated DNA repair dioxygenase AlkB